MEKGKQNLLSKHVHFTDTNDKVIQQCRCLSIASDDVLAWWKSERISSPGCHCLPEQYWPFQLPVRAAAADPKPPTRCRRSNDAGAGLHCFLMSITHCFEFTNLFSVTGSVIISDHHLYITWLAVIVFLRTLSAADDGQTINKQEKDERVLDGEEDVHVTADTVIDQQY